MARSLCLAIVAATLVLLAPATALAADIEFRGWGPRVGLSDNPDQVFGGVHFDLGEFAPRVRFQPSVEVGFGDDVTTIAGNVMVAYYFEVKGSFTPYAGGEVSVLFLDPDHGDSDTEIGPAAVGGFETKLSDRTTFLVELQLGFSDDLPDAKLLAGWTFRKTSPRPSRPAPRR